jgi:hypothetical protein
MTPFNLEMAAYERILPLQRMTKYVPSIYGYDARPLSGWGFPDGDVKDHDLRYAIVMEWIENAEILSTENITVDNASVLLAGLSKIHEGGVLHYDTYRRNILVVPETMRALWIDFSCSQTYENNNFAQEMELAGGMILEHVLLAHASVLTQIVI